MQFSPLVSDHVQKLTPPTKEELDLLRSEIDPDKLIIGRVGT